MAGADARAKEEKLRKQQKKDRLLAVPKHTYDRHALVVELHEQAKNVDESVKVGELLFTYLFIIYLFYLFYVMIYHLIFLFIKGLQAKPQKEEEPATTGKRPCLR